MRRNEMVCELIALEFGVGSNSDLLHKRLYSAIRRAIVGGRLPAGAPLPGTRVLATELGLGRNTVARAYERLLAEGYAENGAAGRSSFVSGAAQALRPSCRPARGSVGISRRGVELMHGAGASPIQRGAFVAGVPDSSHFPFDVWRRMLARHYRVEHGDLLQYTQSGYGPLKRALAQYLNITRSVQCAPQQVIIVNGTHQGLDLAARLLADHGDRAWIEDPGYWGARNVLRAAGLQLEPIEVDAQGIAPSAAQWREPPRLIMVSPSSQYPTGAVLPLERRMRLLEAAAAAGSWILEDDYDNELRQHAAPVASLFGLSRAQRVIYLGTFSKVMFPGLRLSYMVVPESLVDVFTVGNAELYRGGRLPEQATLAEFIESGHFSTHIARMRGIYRERREALRAVLDSRLGGALDIAAGQAGLQMACRFRETVDDRQLSADALREGIVVRPLSPYYADPERSASGMNLGFAAVPVPTLEPAAQRLSDLIERRLRGGRA